MDFGSLGGILTGVLTIAVVITGGLLGLQQGSMSTLRNSNDDLRKRVADLEAEQTRLKLDNTEVKAENATLRTVVTGEVHWTALTDMLEHHHAQAEAHWAGIEVSMESIKRLLGSDRAG